MNMSLFIKIIGILIVIYLLIVFYVYSKQRSLLYVPNIDNYDDETLIINANEVFIENSDGNKLRSVFYESPITTKTTLLMFHGNAGPIENRFYKLGLIGSKTKKARFKKQLVKTGFSLRDIEKIICPIGLQEIDGDEPFRIALSVAGQISNWTL